MDRIVRKNPSFGSKIPKMGFFFITILVLAFCVLSFTSGSTPIPQTGSLWVGEKKNIINPSPSDGSRLLEISTEHLEDIAVDNNRGVVWVGTKKEVIQYTLEGREVFRYALAIRDEEDSDDDDNGERVVHISLDPRDGSLWIDAKDDVIKLAFNGYKLLKVENIGHIEDVSVDISNGSCWVGLKDKVIKYASNGTPILTFNVENGNKINALAAEPFSHSLWMGTKKGLIRVNKNGLKEFHTDEPSDIQDLKIDVKDASVWVVTKKLIFKYDSAGQKLFRVRPCPENGGDGKGEDGEDNDSEDCESNLITLAVDYSNNTAWVAWRKALLKLSSIGESLLWLNGFKQIEALDIGLPKLGIDITAPLNATIVDTPSIIVKGTVTDPTAKVTVNGLEAAVAGNIFQAEGIQLSLGPNTITATAQNIAGITASDSITVTYQPPLTVAILSPVDRAILSTAVTDVIGTVSDPGAEVTVSGISAAVSSQGVFTASNVPLVMGENVVTAVAKDKTGWSASHTIRVTCEMSPLTIDINAPLDGAAFSTSHIDVTGNVSNSSASVEVNGITATVSDNTFTATGVPIIPGENTITAIATDEAGSLASDAIKVNYTWLNISITYPSDGDVLSASPIDVEGIISDPSAHVDVNGREAAVATDGSFIAHSVKLSQDQNQISAQTTNSIGQTDEDIVQVSYEQPSVPLSASILAPENGAIIETPYFEVTGVVSDPDATVLVNDIIAQVDEDGFYNASIYACEKEIVPDGGTGGGQWDCAITVTAYSKDGQAMNSTTIVYTYSPSDDPLTVKITDPAQNQIVTYSPYEIQGEFHDVLSSVATVQIMVNGIIPAAYGIGENSFSASITLNDGLNYITIRATNAVGHDAFDTIKIIYDLPDKPVGITIYSPLNQAIVNYSPITVFGGVTHSAAEVDVNGVYADVDKDLRSFKAVSVPLSPGENVITAGVWIPTEETATDSRTVIYDLNYPSPPAPTLSTLPKYAQSSVEVSGLTLPSYKVEIFANGTSRTFVWADSNGIFKATLSLTDEGPNHISARAYDTYGNKSNLSNGEIVIKDTIKPFIKNVYIGQLEYGLAASRVRIVGETEPLAKVEVTVDNVLDYKYKLTADEQGLFSVYTHLSMGDHYLFVKATDRVGNTANYGASYPLHPFTTGSPPPPRIDPVPSPINETSIIIEGNAYAGFYVDLYRNNELLGGMMTDDRGRFKFEGISLVLGTNILKVRQIARTLTWSSLGYIDISGADSDDIVVNVISGTPTRPNVKIDFPINGAITNAEFLPLRGTIDAPDATLRLNDYYNYNGYATATNGRFVSNQKIPLLPGENTLWAEATAPDGSRGVDKIKVYFKKDAQVPSVNITNPTKGVEVYDQYISTSGTMADSAQKIITNESEATLNNGTFESTINIFNGYVYNSYGYERMLTAWAMDANSNIGHHDIPFRYKYIPVPTLSITSPLDNEILSSSPITVTGSVYDASEVMVNGISAIIDNNIFTASLDLKEGQNTITVIAKNTVKAKVIQNSVTYIPGSTITLTSLAIEPSTSVAPFGGTLQLRVMGIYSDGSRIDLTQASTWTSSNINTVTVNNGLVTGIIQGSATITATYGGLTANRGITIGQPTLKTIIIAYEWQTPDGRTTWFTDSPLIQTGENLQLKAFGKYTDGNLYTLSRMLGQLTWTSSSPNIADIDTNGLSTGIAKGATTITATHQYGGTTVIGARTLTVEPPPVYIFITTPEDNSTTNKAEVTITGTVISQANEIGITVNGKIATIYGNQFIANKVPLQEGSNIITAKAIDSNGAEAEAKIIINAVPSGNYVRLTSNIESGIPPMELTLTVDSSISLGSTNTSLTYTNPAQVEILTATPNEYKVRINAEGIYQFIVNVTDTQGNTYTDTIAITVWNKTELDNLLKAKWEEMKGALTSGDVGGAVGYIASRSKDMYRYNFEIMSSMLPTIIQDMGNITLVKVTDNVAEYEMLVTQDGQTLSFYVKFIQDIDGIWKIKFY